MKTGIYFFEEGAKTIDEALRINSTLTELNLRCMEQQKNDKKE